MAFVLIMLYVNHELSYDQNHPDKERIFRLTEVIESEGFIENSSSCPFPFAPTLLLEFPNLLEDAVRFFDFQIPTITITVGDSAKYNEQDFYFVDSTVFTMLDFPLKIGNPEKALEQPNSVVLTEEMAQKYFGKEDPIGKTLKYEQNVEFQVTGILDKRAPSHFSSERSFFFFHYPQHDAQPKFQLGMESKLDLFKISGKCKTRNRCCRKRLILFKGMLLNL